MKLCLFIEYATNAGEHKKHQSQHDVISEKLVHCIFILWANTQNLTWSERWMLIEKSMPFDEILR